MIGYHFPRQYCLRLLPVYVSIAIWAHAAHGQVGEQTAFRGKVLNEHLEPLSGARVDISTAAPKSGRSIFSPSSCLDCQKWTTTDQSGHFEIGKLDPTLRFRLLVSAPGYKTLQTNRIAPDNAPLQIKLKARPKTIDPQRVVQGVILNEQGVPISGALIDPDATIGESGLRDFWANGTSPAVSNAQGRFEIDLVDGTTGIDALVFAEGYCDSKIVGLVPSEEPKEFVVSAGFSVEGRVERDGQPIDGMTVAVTQTDRRSGKESFFLRPVSAICDADGHFRIEHLRPELEYCVYSVIGEVDRSASPVMIESVRFDAPTSGKSLNIGTLEVIEPISFAGRLVLPDGSAPAGGISLRLGRDPAYDSIKIPVAADGSFTISGLAPEVFELAIASEQYDIDTDRMNSMLWTEKSTKLLIDKSTRGFVLPIRPAAAAIPAKAADGSQTLEGHVEFSNGQGMAGIRVDATHSVDALGGDRGFGDQPVATSTKDGRFAIKRLPNARVWLKLYLPDPDRMHFWYLGMVQPPLSDDDIHIILGPEFAFESDKVSGTIEGVDQ